MASVPAVKPRFAEASRTLLRDTVLDAVHDLLADRRWAEVTMGEVAERAGVSRQTVYNTFGGRDGLSQAYVIREADRFLVVVEEAVRANEQDPRSALAAPVPAVVLPGDPAGGELHRPRVRHAPHLLPVGRRAARPV